MMTMLKFISMVKKYLMLVVVLRIRKLFYQNRLKQKLRNGKNVLAMYCENTGGQAYIDAGLYDRLPSEFINQADTEKSRNHRNTNKI